MRNGNVQPVPLIVRKVNLLSLKSNFTKKYPTSAILRTILSLPDQISTEELIGASAVLLALLDTENHNNIGGGK